MFEQISVNQLILGGLLVISALLLRKVFADIVLKQLKKVVKSSETAVDDQILLALESPLKLIFIVVIFYFVTIILSVDFTQLIRSLVIFTIFWGIYRCIEPLSFIIDTLTLKFGAELTQALKNFFVKGVKIFLILIALTILLNEWGVNVIGLLASLSLAGAAIALAAKETLANILSVLTIIFDKMFKQGDWIMTPEVEGIVEEIGSRATKIRTFSKALVTVPNSTLVNSALTNWSEMTNRRIKMRLALEYRTPRKNITAILQRIKGYIQSNPDIESSNVTTLVYLVELNTHSIDILLYYFTKTTNWEEWMRVREENMLEFMKIIEEEGAAFAFPSQQIYVEKLAGDLPQ